ncbi:MAG TPA: sigma-70 family RNA polymerase sigma factor [Polyangiaceae bacterium]|nr:sigma-70 family RNA polymerase sigma factor [Polyangiaceae bacterium]
MEDRSSGVSAARPGADARLAVMVDAHFDFIWRTLRRLGIPASDADDGAQRVFVVAARKLSDIELGKERSFLFASAYRVAREMRRSVARHPAEALPEDELLPDPAPNPEELSDRKRAREVLDSVLDTLPIENRTVFVLYEMEELTMAEIAALTELPPGTVASRLRRARELFRDAADRIRARETRGGGKP